MILYTDLLFCTRQKINVKRLLFKERFAFFSYLYPLLQNQINDTSKLSLFINNNGVSIASASNLKVNNISCEDKMVPALSSSYQFTGTMIWTENGTSHTATEVTFTVSSADVYNAICTQI